MPGLNYFPPSLLNDYSAKSFSKTLHKLEELPLFPVSEEHFCEFRFLFLPSFQPGQLIRVRAVGTTWWIVHKWSEWTGQKNHTVLHRAERILSGSEARNLETLINQLKFFSLSAENDEIGCDGETWLLEGVIKSEYHVVHRWCPGLAGLVNFGDYLLKLSRKTQNSSSSSPQDSIFAAFQESLHEEEIKQAFEFHQILQRTGSNRQNSTLQSIANILRTQQHFDAVLQLVQNAQDDPSDLAQLAIVVAEKCEEGQALALMDGLRSRFSRLDNVYAFSYDQAIGPAIAKILAIRICKTRNVFKIFNLTNQSFQIVQASRYLTRSRVVAGIFQEIDSHSLSKRKEILVWLAILCSELKYRLGRSKLLRFLSLKLSFN